MNPRYSREAYEQIKKLEKETGKTQFQLARENGFNTICDWHRSLMTSIEVNESMDKYFSKMAQ